MISTAIATTMPPYRPGGRHGYRRRRRVKTLELYTDSVFSVGIRSVFLGIYHTDTEGKFGRYISVSKRGPCPSFSSKGGQWPPF
jgi:hypothetical protein